MSGFPPDPPPSDRHGDAVRAMELLPDPSEAPSGSTAPPLEPDEDEEETQETDGGWRRDGELQGCGQLERRWVLWHEFMKEHAHLDAWLRLAEQAVSSPSPAPITYVTAKEEVRKFERLRCDAASRLVQLDSLTQRNRALTRLFQGAMKARLLAAARDCGRRWDDVNTKLETVSGRLKLFVSEWEEFEAEREELALLLADLDARLSAVDQLTGNTCDKLSQLQSFQQCVCVNSGRVNVLLQRGEALIQRSEPGDAQRVEALLLELLRRCSLVYNNIARTHTRLLSMRLVFEDDWILSPAPDSGCPSETLLEDEGALDKTNLDLPVISHHPTDFRRSAHPGPASSSSPAHLPPPPAAATSSSSPTHEHLGLEWDPSVDIGRSVSRDDADSSYFSASTGLCHRDGVKRRRSYLSSLGSSQSDLSGDITNQEADLRLDGWLDHAHPAQGGGTLTNGDQWATSTPDRRDGEPVSFDGGRVRAWLRVQSPAPAERRTSCSRAVQTDGQVECHLDGSRTDATNQPRPHLSTHQPSPSRDLKASSDWMKHLYRPDQAEEEPSCCEEAERLLSEQSRGRPSSPLCPALLCLLLAAALALLACLIWVLMEPPCHCGGRTPRGFHLALRYVNGPPPT